MVKDLRRLHAPVDTGLRTTRGSHTESFRRHDLAVAKGKEHSSLISPATIALRVRYNTVTI
jgi:hypothetical protein